MTTFPHRLMGASVLDVATYEEVEADRTATAQAFVVVLASSLAGGIGATGFVREGTPLVTGVFFWSAVSLIAWAAWALLVFEIGGRRRTAADHRVLIRARVAARVRRRPRPRAACLCLDDGLDARRDGGRGPA